MKTNYKEARVCGKYNAPGHQARNSKDILTEDHHSHWAVYHWFNINQISEWL